VDRHEQLARELLKLMPYHDTHPLMQTMWQHMAAQLGRCTQCVERYHFAREWLKEEYDTDSLLPMTDMLQRLDAQRITRSLVHADDLPAAFFEVRATFQRFLSPCVVHDRDDGWDHHRSSCMPMTMMAPEPHYPRPCVNAFVYSLIAMCTRLRLVLDR
jgi:hypothetical protein